MTTMTGRRRPRAGRGFTLVELLLTTVLVLLLLGAVVFSFSTLQRGAELDEGAAQLEGLLRFARAHAANTGRQVQLSFEEELVDDVILTAGTMRVTWEPNPLEQPGVFEDLRDAALYLERITNLIFVETVRMLDPNGAAVEVAVAKDTSDVLPSADEPEEFLPPINFYPDGTSDSAEIILNSWAEDDPRRIAVRLVGITGTIRRQLVVEAEESPELESPPDAKDRKPEAPLREAKPVSTNLPSAK